MNWKSAEIDLDAPDRFTEPEISPPSPACYPPSVVHALRRFQRVVDALECACDDGWTCTVHNDRILARDALKCLGG